MGGSNHERMTLPVLVHVDPLSLMHALVISSPCVSRCSGFACTGLEQGLSWRVQQVAELPWSCSREHPHHWGLCAQHWYLQPCNRHGVCGCTRRTPAACRSRWAALVAQQGSAWLSSSFCADLAARGRARLLQLGAAAGPAGGGTMRPAAAP
jgi:hypothetical protein